ncbi:hypothetical protein ANN_12652 [Periplaneta americana]|uniref:Reverse transcriptase n=1 Tax=Periplaneta americana TaxID=6978 RepID=A0ABQ8TJ50_PERAM|nr:hypothetical protein ANN_12652 [Periplaneta americana]
MEGLCEGGNEAPDSLKALSIRKVKRGKQEKRKKGWKNGKHEGKQMNLKKINKKQEIQKEKEERSLSVKLQFKAQQCKMAVPAIHMDIADVFQELVLFFGTSVKFVKRGICQLPHKDKGVCTFEECPKANSWISSKKCLSSSEYINAIKMSCNVTTVRSVPGRTFSTTCCRHPGCSETETLGHVLGFCKKGELLRKNRHHRARTAIANLLRNRGWEVHEEIHCGSEDDSHRRVDIIAINRRTQKAMVLDPTICFERDTNQALQMNDDKRAEYVPCLPYLSEKYGISLYNWDVADLLFGARGCLPKFTSCSQQPARAQRKSKIAIYSYVERRVPFTSVRSSVLKRTATFLKCVVNSPRL